MSDFSERLIITNNTDLFLLQKRFGIGALRDAMNDPTLNDEIKAVVACYVLLVAIGSKFNRAVVCEYPEHWKQRRQ